MSQKKRLKKEAGRKRWILPIAGGLIALVVGGVLILSKAPSPLKKFDKSGPNRSEHQLRLEKKIESDISHLFDKILGKNAYHVSAIVNLHNVDEVVKDVSIEPKVVTYDSKEDYKNTDTVERKAPTPAQAELGGAGALPGMFDSAGPFASGVPGGFDDLPGFSDFSAGVLGLPTEGDATNIEENLPGFPSITPSGGDEAGPSPTPKPLPDEKLQNTVSRTVSNSKVYFNKKQSTKVIPENKIESILVSIVIDENVFSQSEIDKKELTKVLFNMSAFDKERGDKVVISIVPFTEMLINWRGWLFGLKRQILKFMPPFWGLLAAVILFASAFGLTKLAKKVSAAKAKKKQQAEAAARRQAEMEKQKKIRDEKEWQKRRDRVVAIAQKKPDTMANLLLNWMDDSHPSSN